MVLIAKMGEEDVEIKSKAQHERVNKLCADLCGVPVRWDEPSKTGGVKPNDRDLPCWVGRYFERWNPVEKYEQAKQLLEGGDYSISKRKDIDGPTMHWSFVARVFWSTVELEPNCRLPEAICLGAVQAVVRGIEGLAYVASPKREG